MTTAHKFIHTYEENPGYVQEIERVTKLFEPRLEKDDHVQTFRHIEGDYTFAYYEDWDWTFLIRNGELGFWRVSYVDIPGRTRVFEKKLTLLPEPLPANGSNQEEGKSVPVNVVEDDDRVDPHDPDENPFPF